MSNAVVSLREKQSSSGNDDTRETYLTVGDLPTFDSAMNGKTTEYCFICNCSTDHDLLKCPKRSKVTELGCSICGEPCDIKGHEGNWTLQLKWCLHCSVFGDHWTIGCPTPDDLFF